MTDYAQNVKIAVAMVIIWFALTGITKNAYNLGKHDADAWYAAHPQCPPTMACYDTVSKAARGLFITGFMTNELKDGTIFTPQTTVNGAAVFIQRPHTVCFWQTDENMLWHVSCRPGQ